MKGETADNTEKMKYEINVSANQILNNISSILTDMNFALSGQRVFNFFSLSCLQSLLSPPHFL